MGLAVPDPVSASAYLLGYQTLVSSFNIPGFYFEAFDESWKVAAEGIRGACWGIWDKVGNLKPGNNAFFQGALAANTWTGLSPVDGPGTPTIHISSAPSYGDSSTWVSGKAVHVSPDDHHISMYIHIKNNNRWYMKPFASTPYFIFQPDGNWRSPMATGGMDFIADKIRVYLFPGSYIPPIVYESFDLPAEFENQGLSKMEIFRTPNALSATITSPANGAIVSGPTPIHVDAESTFGVTNVVFSMDGVALSTDSFHPFDFLWDPAGTTPGVHTLTARVTEITGNFIETSLQVSKP